MSLEHVWSTDHAITGIKFSTNRSLQTQNIKWSKRLRTTQRMTKEKVTLVLPTAPTVKVTETATTKKCMLTMMSHVLSKVTILMVVAMTAKRLTTIT